MNRPLVLWLLIFSLLFLALGGLYGGIAMLTDPTGHSLQLNEMLPLLPVPDYILPGLFLLFVMGLAPLIFIYGLLTLPNWTWANTLSRWSGHYWAWTGTLALSILLAIWLGVQGLLIGFKWPIQYITAVNGLLIFLLAFMPSIRNLYAR